MRFNNMRVISVLVLALLLGVFSASAFAGSTLDKIKAAGVITVGNSPDYPPFEAIGDNGEPRRFRRGPVERHRRKDGRQDPVGDHGLRRHRHCRAVRPGGHGHVRGQHFRGARQAGELFPSLYCPGPGRRGPHDSDIKSAADLKGRKIAVQLGTTGEQQADKIEGAEVVKPESYNIAFMMLNNKAADAVIADLSVADEFIKRGTFQRAGEPLSYEEFAMISRKGNDDLLNALNKALEEVTADGTYAAIVKKWNL